uniref:(northern house mosquito) hypothetical protein n=1 Tax=Culex pipiens TaxID=7175 RepID=A0A8D8C5K1_CULPI
MPFVFYKDVDSDQLVTYRVQDFTEDRHADVIQHYRENFVDDEPLAASRKISSSKVAMAEIVAFWSWCLEQRMTVVCYKDGSDEIVGANLLHVATPEKSISSGTYVLRTCRTAVTVKTSDPKPAAQE